MMKKKQNCKASHNIRSLVLHIPIYHILFFRRVSVQEYYLPKIFSKFWNTDPELLFQICG